MRSKCYPCVRTRATHVSGLYTVPAEWEPGRHSRPYERELYRIGFGNWSTSM
jgi:hypothetical protein